MKNGILISQNLIGKQFPPQFCWTHEHNTIYWMKNKLQHAPGSKTSRTSSGCGEHAKRKGMTATDIIRQTSKIWQIRQHVSPFALRDCSG